MLMLNEFMSWRIYKFLYIYIYIIHISPGNQFIYYKHLNYTVRSHGRPIPILYIYIEREYNLIGYAYEGCWEKLVHGCEDYGPISYTVDYIGEIHVH